MHSAKLTVALGIIAIGLWFLFDRTLYGFLLAAVTAAIGTCFVSLLVRSGVYRWAKLFLFEISLTHKPAQLLALNQLWDSAVVALYSSFSLHSGWIHRQTAGSLSS